MGFGDKLKNAFKSNKKEEKQTLNEENPKPQGEKRYNFKYLESLIMSADLTVSLESDIVLDDGEEEKYPEGIVILNDNLVIQGNGHSIDARGKTMIFSIQKGNIDLQNITFKNGSFQTGAIANFSQNLRIANSTFKDNSGVQGGALNNQLNGRISLINCTFDGNEAQRNGGAIFNNNVVNLINCRFSNNSAPDGASVCTGPNSLVDFKDCRFENNKSDGSGGALSNHGEFKVNDTQFINNSAQQGGAINNQAGSQITIEGCLFEANKSYDAGGAIFNWNRMVIDNCSFKNNMSRSCGGIWNHKDGDLNIANSRFEKNTGNTLGGAILNDGRLEVKDSSFINNVAKTDGGGAIRTSSDTVSHSGCIFEANKPDDIYHENGKTIGTSPDNIIIADDAFKEGEVPISDENIDSKDYCYDNGRNYAREFKDIYETVPINIATLFELMDVWGNESDASSDANFFLALAVRGALVGILAEQDGESGEFFKAAALKSIERSKEFKPKDPSLHGWFVQLAQNITSKNVSIKEM